MFVERAFVHAEHLFGRDRNAWPFDIPGVVQLVDAGLTFERPVTFLVGENGSGKSTIIEGIAEAFGLDAQGGRAGRKYGNDRPKTALGEVMSLDLTRAGAKMKTGPRLKRKGYFLRAETAFGFMAAVTGAPGYWQEEVTSMSHGEGFLAVFDAMFQEPGLYLMDEPEAALSFSSCLRLVALIHELGQSGAQVICATHSPILAATPGAEILELGDDGIRRCAWNDLLLIDHWRSYLDSPERYLRHLVD